MHYKQNNKESKSFVQGLRLLGNTLPRGIKGILKKNGYNYSEIVSKWNILVGEDISSITKPSHLNFSKNKFLDATLIINVHEMLATEIELLINKIIQRINFFFGLNAVKKIKLKKTQDLSLLKK